MFLEASPEDPGLAGLLTMPLMLVAMVGVFYFLMIRPQSKQKKEKARMLNELIVGDEVTTIGGIVGKVVSIKDDALTIETGAEKVRIKIMRWAISNKGVKESSE